MTIFNNAQDEIDSTNEVVEFLNAKRNIVDLFYKNRVLFEDVVEFLDEFHSLDQYDLDYEWVKIKSIDDMPDDLDLSVKSCIFDFEKDIENMLDGNEWGKTYNLTTGEDYGLKTDGLPKSVNLDVPSDDDEDILLTIHIHPQEPIPSTNDIFNCINHVKYVVIVSPKDVIVLESKNVEVSDDIYNIIDLEKDNCLEKAYVDFIGNGGNFYNLLKSNYINNIVFNKYLKFYWWFK